MSDKKYYREHRESELERKKKYYQENKERILEYRQNNRETILESHRIYNLTHRKERSIYKRIKLRTDLKFNLNQKMNRAIGKTIKGNKNDIHLESLLGYSYNDLIKRLNKTMPEGYTWRDVLNGKLHIDHIIPISVFNFTKSGQIGFKRCWALKNLQLLPARENLKKGNKLTRPFQPALAI